MRALRFLRRCRPSSPTNPLAVVLVVAAVLSGPAWSAGKDQADPIPSTPLTQATSTPDLWLGRWTTVTLTSTGHRPETVWSDLVAALNGQNQPQPSTSDPRIALVPWADASNPAFLAALRHTPATITTLETGVQTSERPAMGDAMAMFSHRHTVETDDLVARACTTIADATCQNNPPTRITDGVLFGVRPGPSSSMRVAWTIHHEVANTGAQAQTFTGAGTVPSGQAVLVGVSAAGGRDLKLYLFQAMPMPVTP